MKLGEIHSAPEVVNFLVDKLGYSYITSTHQHPPQWSKGTTYNIPDIHVFNFPVKGQQVNDSSTTLLLRRSLRSNISLHAKDDMTTTVLISGQWIIVRMRLSCLMYKNSRSWIVCLLRT
jgi:hypothetical protein